MYISSMQLQSYVVDFTLHSITFHAMLPKQFLIYSYLLENVSYVLLHDIKLSITYRFEILEPSTFLHA